MQAWGWTLLLVLVAVAALVLRQLRRYPGGWRFAFSAEYGAARSDLDRARGELSGLERSARQELSGAQGAVKAAVAAHGRRVRDAEEQVAYLRDPGRGGYRAELGDLCLYEHVLVVSTYEYSGDLPLHETAVRSEHTPRASHLYVIGPDGRQHLVTYPAAETPEGHVRQFVVDVHNAIAEAKSFRRDRPAQLREARAELRRATNDTAEQEAARRRLEEVTARQGGDLRIPAARQSRDAAYDRWQQLTGHRPR
ncbi:hypothetical protein [Kitasatospora sp. NPDC090308]|uniref:hypothetical protein n=1 Tax=Kitasatospora sp. NPDC090308 TaxID=3364082 RepID=UPI0038261348